MSAVKLIVDISGLKT